MEKLWMCRVCLGEDIRLVPIVGTYLQETYESLVSMPFETKDGRPILVCYICRARLKNCYELRKTCLQSEELFTQMLSFNKLEQLQTLAINKKRLTMHNVIHLSVGHELGMDADSVGVEVLKCEVKDEPYDNDDVSEDVLKESSISDDAQYANSFSKNEKSMLHKLEMDTDTVGVETLLVFCDVKNEQSDPEGASTPKKRLQNMQRSSEDSTSSKLNKHELIQDTFKKHNEVAAAVIPDDIKEITAIVKYTCDTCQQCYSSKRDLEGHVRLCSDAWKKDLSRMNITNAHTHTTQKPHQCNVCNKRFSRTYHLTCHSLTHTGEKLYHCEVCKKQFSRKSHCTVHMRTHTGEKPYHCNICMKQFSQKSNFTTHMHTHTGEKPYLCDICKKHFSYKSHYTAHRRKHTGERPYHCDICKKQFSQKSCLKLHIRTHTGDKPYHCVICNKKYSRKGHLTTHMRIHTGEKLFHCSICKKKFSHKSHFTSHVRTHTGEKPYHCNICKKQFSRKSHLATHEYTHTTKKR